MKNHVSRALGLIAALVLALVPGGCAASPEKASSTGGQAATGVPFGVDCPCCFTIVEFVQADPPQPGQVVEVQCPRCCELLTFTTVVGPGYGPVQVATTRAPMPQPAELAAPMR